MTSINERYTVARHTSNLRSNPRTRMSASDVLGASGMAAQDNEAALLLWGIAYQGKSRDMHALVDAMAKMLMRSRHAPSCLSPKAINISRACLAAWLSKCEVCGGVGYELIPHTIARKEDEPCSACRGTGKLPLPDNKAIQWLSGELDRLQSVAAGKVMQKLADDMDF